jgi:uncharacterized protein YjbI with pentapeptide repeats
MKTIIIDGVEYVEKNKVEENKVEEKTLGIAIKNRFTGSIIFQSTKTTFRDAVKECVEKANKKSERANLTSANLTSANLTSADLTDADLTDANLTDADLTACKYYMGSSNQNFEALCKAIKTIKWNNQVGNDFLK